MNNLYDESGENIHSYRNKLHRNNLEQAHKMKTVIDGTVCDVKDLEYGMEFTLLDANGTYHKCYVPEEAIDDLCMIEPGIQYHFEGVQNEKGFYANKAERLCVFEKMKGKETKNIVGIAKFDNLPDPQKDTFAIKVVTDNGKEVCVKLDRYFTGKTLTEGKRYEMCISADENEIYKFKELSGGGTNKVVANEMLERIDERLLYIECIPKENKEYYTVVEFELTGQPYNVTTTDSSVEFQLKDENDYHCIYDFSKLKRISVREIEEKCNYIIKGALIETEFYVSKVEKISK